MTQLKIKGVGLISVDEITAKEVEEMLSDPNLKEKNIYIKTKKWSGYLSEITGVIRDSEPIFDNKTGKEQEKSYKEFRDSFLKRSNEEKGKDTKMFELYYCAVNDKFGIDFKPDNEVLEKVIKVQTDFFTKNPTRCFCDPALFKPFVTFSESRCISAWSKLVFNMIENQIYTDVRYAKYKK